MMNHPVPRRVLSRAAVLISLISSSPLPVAAQPRNPEVAIRIDLELGSVQPGSPHRFGLIRSLAIAEDGSFYLVDAHSRELRSYGAQGEQRWTHAVPDRQNYDTVVVHGDRVAVLESWESPRVMTFRAADGRKDRTMPVQSSRGATVSLVGGSADGWMLIRRTAQELRGGRLRPSRQISYSALMLTHDGKVREFATRTDTGPRHILSVGNRDVVANAPFWLTAAYAVASSGDVYFALGGEPTLAVLSPSKGASRSLPLQIQRVVVTPSDVTTFIDGWRVARRSITGADSAAAIMAQLPAPTHRPVVRRLWVASDSLLALIRADTQPPEPPEQRKTILQFMHRTTGVPTGFVTIPAGEEILAVRHPWVFTGQLDSSAVVGEWEGRPRYLQRIRRYAVEAVSRSAH